MGVIRKRQRQIPEHPVIEDMQRYGYVRQSRYKGRRPLAAPGDWEEKLRGDGT